VTTAARSSPVRVVVRADASVALGAGHVMRCLTLACAMRGRGWEVVFASRALAGNLLAFIASEGFAVRALAAEAPGDEAAQASEVVAALGGERVDALVVDHYDLAARFAGPFQAGGAKVLVVDDLANRVHACDVLLDQNLVEGFERRYEGLVPPGATLLLGPRHVLLREEFATQAIARGGPVPRLLLSFGGTDPSNVTEAVLGALRTFVWAPWEADVVIGQTNPHRARIEAIVAEDPRLVLHVQTARMAALMAQADLMVGAGGSTHWERCALGLPAIVVSLAENQRPTTACVAARGACVDLGPSEDVDRERFAREILALLGDRERLRAMGERAATLVPCEGGVARVVDALSAKVCGP
jgi:UDP-2,4-diacetamido-2,4,6-trideoxy-beta-L-altropyranose hydrolase